MVDRSHTPTQTQEYSPLQVEVADSFDLPKHTDHPILEVRRFNGQSIDVNNIGGQPHPDINIEVEGVNGAESLTSLVRVDAQSLYNFNNPTTAGPLATSRFEWKVNNRGNVDYTSSSANNPYKAYINYTVNNLSVAEKIKRNLPLTNSEQQLAAKYGLKSLSDKQLPVEVPDVIRPNLKTKEVIEQNEVATTIDVSQTGTDHAVNIASESNLKQRKDVIYVNSIETNAENYSFGDKVVIEFVKDGVNPFYDLETRGMPGQSDNYSADLHIPFTHSMDVNVFASNTVDNVNIKMQYTTVKRTIVEKALFGLEKEVSDMTLYNNIRERMNAGVNLKGVTG